MRYDQREIFGILTEMKNSIVCMHISNYSHHSSCQLKSRSIGDDSTVYLLNTFKYPRYDDFYTVLSAALNDNQKRYFIPEGITYDMALEELIDNLFRSGFMICSEVDDNV